MNEVSKIGQPEEEPIEGRIVGPYEGPMMTDMDWQGLNEELNRNRQYYRASRAYVATDGTWQDIGTAGSFTYEYSHDPAGGFSTANGWWDEIQHFTTPITVETTFENVNPEMFKLLTGYDYEVLRLVQNTPWEGSDATPPIPPVDISKVRWPHG